MSKYIFNHPFNLIRIILFTILSSASIAGVPLLMKYTIEGIQSSDDSILFITIILFPVVVSSILLFEYLNKIAHAALYQKIMIDLKNDIMIKTYQLSYAQFYLQSSDYYLNFLTEDTKILYRDYYDSLIGFIISLISLLVYGTYMFFLNWILAVVILITALFSLLVPKLSGRKLASYRKNQSQSHANYLKKIKDLLNGFVLNTEKSNVALNREHSKANNDLESKIFTYQKYRSFVEIFGALSLYIVNTAAFIAGIFLIRRDFLDLGSFIALMAFVDILVIPIRDIIFQFIGIKSSNEIKQKFKQYLDIETKKHPFVKSFNHQIVLKNIYFEREAFKLEIDKVVFEKGKRYAIIGSSGSGKTTLLQILLRRLQNHEGTVEIDGIDQTYSDVSLMMSEISQNPFIFNADAMDNITLFSSYVHPKLETFIKRINAENIIKSNLGESGSKISGGEKKKIEILRALSRGAEVLIGDEMFAGLDEINKKEIMEFLLGEKHLTLVIVTHDLNQEYLDKFDQVIDISKINKKIIK